MNNSIMIKITGHMFFNIPGSTSYLIIIVLDRQSKIENKA